MKDPFTALYDIQKEDSMKLSGQARAVLRRAGIPEDHDLLDLTPQEMLAVVRACDAYHEGHFVYGNGSHGAIYIDLERLLVNTELAGIFLRRIANVFLEQSVDVVLAPSLRDHHLAGVVAWMLTAIRGKNVPALTGVKTDNGYALRPWAAEMIRGGNVGIVLDTMTTGATVRRIRATIEAAGGRVVALGTLWNKGVVLAHEVDLEINQLGEVVEPRGIPDQDIECRLCLRGVPINVEFGHGASSRNEIENLPLVETIELP